MRPALPLMVFLALSLLVSCRKASPPTAAAGSAASPAPPPGSIRRALRSGWLPFRTPDDAVMTPSPRGRFRTVTLTTGWSVERTVGFYRRELQSHHLLVKLFPAPGVERGGFLLRAWQPAHLGPNEDVSVVIAPAADHRTRVEIKAVPRLRHPGVAPQTQPAPPRQP